MAKDIESLEASRDRRAEIQMKYGFIPTSIIRAEKNKLQARDDEAETRNYYSTTNVTSKIVAHDVFDVSGQSCRGKMGALSGYPQNVGRYLVKMYSSEGDTILDPFAGHNSRMELVYKLGRNYIGYDISSKFMAMNRKVAADLLGKTQSALFPINQSIQLIEDDARNIIVKMPVDMVLTSPPYWDLEYYGSERGQLGNLKTYAAFIGGLECIVGKCYDSLRVGGFCCWSINDFRRDGVFYSYHASVISLFEAVGLRLHDIIIVDLGYPIGAAFASQLEGQKRTAKRHEYIVVGQKKDFPL